MYKVERKIPKRRLNRWNTLGELQLADRKNANNLFKILRPAQAILEARLSSFLFILLEI